MVKSLLPLVCILLIVGIGLSGCTTVDNRFIGTWIEEGGDEVSYTFRSDGTFSSTLLDLTGRWEIQDERFILKAEDSEVVILNAQFSFSEDNTRLTLTPEDNGDITVFIKQE